MRFTGHAHITCIFITSTGALMSRLDATKKRIETEFLSCGERAVKIRVYLFLSLFLLFYSALVDQPFTMCLHVHNIEKRRKTADVAVGIFQVVIFLVRTSRSSRFNCYKFSLCLINLYIYIYIYIQIDIDIKSAHCMKTVLRFLM